jgi:hypothetical protein
LRVLDANGREIASENIRSGIQVLAVADLDGDHHAEILCGWGLTREYREATARVTIERLDGATLRAEEVLAPSTTRQEIAALVPEPAPGAPGLLVAYYDSKYMVRTTHLRKVGGEWQTQDVAHVRMAESYTRGDVDGDRQPDLVVGRVYGDAIGVEGDAFLLRPDGGRVPIPTTRGVHGLAVTDHDGDGRAEVYLGDGWHENYGQLARARLTEARWNGRGFDTTLVDELRGPKEYTFWQLAAADLDGDGRPELVGRADAVVRAYRFDGGAWHGIDIAGQARDVATGRVGAELGDAVLVLGDRAELIRLRADDWTPPAAR